MLRVVEHLLMMAAAVLLLWILLSWVDVLCHNDPLTGDYNYNPCNIFMAFSEAE